MAWLTVTEYLCYKSQLICSVCANRSPVLSSFMTYHWFCYSNTTDATGGAGTAPVPRHLRSHQVYSGHRVTQSLVLCVVLCISLFVLFSYSMCARCKWKVGYTKSMISLQRSELSKMMHDGKMNDIN
jgi:hypothetical protein